MLLLVDYGIGNLRSLEKAFQAVGAAPVRSGDPADVPRADRVVLPGVGAFGACAAELKRRGLWEPVKAAAGSGVPLLGVCVGMQLLFEAGEEHGEHGGLGLLPGRVVRFPHTDGAGEPLTVPHMGWNTVRFTRPHPLRAGLDDGAHFYFVHSYHAEPARASDVLGAADYGEAFPAVVQRGNVMGVQFHPEKSQAAGLKLLRNFADPDANGRV
ncbi:MAG: imidazole glycerol phosphate synthase subunit HisH [Rhodothermales bacterium]|nr:imidazole glycerol phosphate synthase subunit HisH [Rhodothermales bacterium]